MISKLDDIVTLETYYNPMLAEIIRARLEANGIPCFLTDESLGPMYPVFNQGSGGIKLKVLAKDVNRCKEILAENDELEED